MQNLTVWMHLTLIMHQFPWRKVEIFLVSIGQEHNSFSPLLLSYINVSHYRSYQNSIISDKARKGGKAALVFCTCDQSSEKVVKLPCQVVNVQLTQRKVFQSEDHFFINLEIQSGNCMLLLLHSQLFHLSGLSPQKRS